MTGFSRAARRDIGGMPAWLLTLAVAVIVAAVGVLMMIRPPDAAPYTGPTVTVSVELPDEVLFIGDSYTQGAGVDTPWTTIVAKGEGWLEANRGLGGTGYLTGSGMAGCGREDCPPYPAVIRSTSSTPDLIIVSGGRNDPMTGFAGGVADTFTAIADRFPGVPVLVTSPLGDDDVAPSLAVKARIIETAAAVHGFTYLDLGQPFEGHPDLIQTDGVHPNAAGHTRLAETFMAVHAETAPPAP